MVWVVARVELLSWERRRLLLRLLGDLLRLESSRDELETRRRRRKGRHAARGAEGETETRVSFEVAKGRAREEENSTHFREREFAGGVGLKKGGFLDWYS